MLFVMFCPCTFNLMNQICFDPLKYIRTFRAAPLLLKIGQGTKTSCNVGHIKMLLISSAGLHLMSRLLQAGGDQRVSHEVLLLPQGEGMRRQVQKQKGIKLCFDQNQLISF